MTTATQPLPRVHDRETSPGTGETGAKDPTEPMAVLALVETPDGDRKMKYEDAARVLNISKTTVYRRVQEAKRQLADQEPDAGYQPPAATIRAYALAIVLVIITLCSISGTTALWVIALKLSRTGTEHRRPRSGDVSLLSRDTGACHASGSLTARETSPCAISSRTAAISGSHRLFPISSRSRRPWPR